MTIEAGAAQEEIDPTAPEVVRSGVRVGESGLRLADGAAIEPSDEPALVTQKPHNKAGIGLILLLGGLSCMGPLAIDMYLPTMPGIAKDLHCDMASVQRTLASYFVGLAFGQLIYGTLSDRFGRKRPMQFGLAVFAIASIGCALSRSVEMLMVLRLFQALGGCAEMVISRAVVRDRFDGREGTRVFSSLILVMGAAPIVAPLMGGWFLNHGGWRGSFWLLAAVAIICFVIVTFRLRESLPSERRRKNGVWDTGRVFSGLLRHRHFMAHVLSSSLMLTGLFAYVGSSSFVFIELFHISPEWFWTLFGGNAAGLILSSQVGGRMAQRIAPHIILRWALIVATVAGGLLYFSATTHLGGPALFFGPLFVFMSSMGFVFPTSTALAMGPQGRVAGNASAMLGFLQFLVSGCGTWLVSALFDGTARPMGEVMFGCAAAALVVNLVLARFRHEHAMAIEASAVH